MAELEAENAELRVQAARVVVLEAQVAELSALVLELRARLKLDSSTSSMPPSSDGLRKKPRRSVPGEGGERRAGKQLGAEGAYREQVADPDEMVACEPECCAACGELLAGCDVVGVERRQVGDIPPQALRWVEYQAWSVRCRCGEVTKAAFPLDVVAPVQFGPGVQAVATYLHAVQHVPYARVQATLSDLMGVEVSLGWIPTAVSKLADLVEPVCVFIADALAGAEQAHFDETGARVAGSLHWVHVASNHQLTHLGLSKRRGQVGMRELGILPRFSGIAVHDGLAAYRQFEITHALCNAHHLRELEALVELYDQPWAQDMIDLLLDAKAAVARAIERGNDELHARQLGTFWKRYQRIIDTGHAANPPPEPTGNRGRPKLGKAGSLLKRLDEHRHDVMRFMTDLSVPFDNNQGERDIRMVKLQQKISGCWRTLIGAERYLRLRTYLQTARKQGKNLFAALREAAEGCPWQPAIS